MRGGVVRVAGATARIEPRAAVGADRADFSVLFGQAIVTSQSPSKRPLGLVRDGCAIAGSDTAVEKNATKVNDRRRMTRTARSLARHLNFGQTLTRARASRTSAMGYSRQAS